MENCIICLRKVRDGNRNHSDCGGAPEGSSSDGDEIVPKSVVTGPGFLRTFNEIWGILQSNKITSVPKPTLSLETAVLEGEKDICTFTSEMPPTMCLRCGDKVVAIENLMKAVRHQFWEIKRLLEGANRKNNEGDMEKPEWENCFAEDDDFQSKDIQLKEEESKMKYLEDLPQSILCTETLDSPMDCDYDSKSDNNSDATISTDEDSNYVKSEEEQEEIQESPVTMKTPNIPCPPGPDPLASVAPSPGLLLPMRGGGTRNPIIFLCTFPNCNEQFNNYIYFTNHQKLCHSVALEPGPSKPVRPPSSASGPGKFRCSIGSCPESFTNSAHLSRHRRACHPGQAPPKNTENPFICDVEGCGRAIKTELGLFLHKKKLHPQGGSNLFPCDVTGCTKTFTTADYILRHKRDCHPEVVTLKTGSSSSFICDLEGCSRVCNTKSGLYTHQIRCHPKKFAELHKDQDKPVECSCGKKFHSKHARYLHMRKHPALHPDFRPGLMRSENSQKCDLCDERILYSDLLFHYIGHVGSPEFVTSCPNDKCPQTFLTSAGLQRHLGWEKSCGVIGKEKKTGLICDTCGFTTDHRLTLKNHVESIHELVGGAVKEKKCPIDGCRKLFNVKQSIYFHLSTHRTKKIVAQKCDKCGDDVRVEGLEEHLKEKHGILEIFGCKQCPFKFSDRDQFMEHLVMEHRHLGILCDVCDNQVKYTSYVDFRQHYFGVHGLCPKKYRCEECGMDFWTKKYKHEHDLLKHNDNGKKSKDDKMQEEKVNKKKLSCDMCEDCSVGFANQLELISHKIKVHGMEPFCCDICKKTFNDKGRLNRHLKEHAGVEFKKDWMCEVEGCGKVFTTKATWSKHTKFGHGGEMPYKCDICGKVFTLASSLKSHRDSVHLKLKPWICEECGEGFTCSGVLRKHKLIHTGERPFACEICGQMFRHKEVLRRHIIGHEKKGKDFKPNGPMKQLRKRKAN